MKVAYLGPKGTFSEEAAYRYFSSNDIVWIMCDTIMDVLETVKEKKADKGIVPIENSIEGTITMTVDGLEGLFIEGELILPVALHLLAVKDNSLRDIKEVWSIHPVLAQCRDFIKEYKVKTKQFNSSALAAETLKYEGRTDAAAIASEWAAQTFELEIIKDNIQDNLENHTRFVVVTQDKSTIENPKKTMLLVTPNEEQDRPGLLSIILNVFFALSINITWIESRPTKKKLGTYRFFIEAEAGWQEEQMNKAITILETFGHNVDVLGSYNTKKL